MRLTSKTRKKCKNKHSNLIYIYEQHKNCNQIFVVQNILYAIEKQHENGENVHMHFHVTHFYSRETQKKNRTTHEQVGILFQHSQNHSKCIFFIWISAEAHE